MIENATNLTTQSEVTAIGYIINWLKAFSSGPYAEPTRIFFLIVTTALVGWWAKMVHKRSDFYNRFQQVYDKLLTPSAVKLDYDITKGLIYTHPEHEEWEWFVSMVNKRLKRKLLKYRAPRLYEKVINAVKDCERLDKTLHSKISSIFVDRLKKEDIEFMVSNGTGEEPSVDYVYPDGVAYCIDYIYHKRNTLRKDISRKDGRYMLLCPGTIAKTTSESKIDELEDFIRSLTNDDEVKKLITERDEAKSDAKKLMDKYNDKLAKVIHDLRFCVW